jgi:hypothetical protein
MAIEVKGNKITRLQYDADGFYNAFYILFNSFQGKEGVESWEQNGDIMSVLGTIGAFAVELYLKLLHTIATFDEKSKSGNHPAGRDGHNLWFIYNEIRSSNSDYTDKLEEIFAKSKLSRETMEAFLQGIKENFIEWRYSYDKGNLNVNLNVLSDTLNILKSFSEEKFRCIADKLGDITEDESQTMTIQDWDAIRKEA